MKSPFVTIVIPAFNHERFVKDAIESVLRQDFQDWELLIIDDGSTDSTPQIVDSYKDHPKVTIIHQQNKGLSPTLNMGLEMARGRYFNFLPSDDFFHREKLSKQVEALNERKELLCLFCDQVPVDDKAMSVDDPIRQWHQVPYETEEEILPRLFEKNFIPAPSALILTSELKKIGGFDESLTYTQDYDLWLRLLPRGRASWLHKPLLFYRWHGENLTYKADEAINFERAYLLAKALQSLTISDIYPVLKKLQGEKRRHEEAKKWLELAELLIKSGLLELLPWSRLFINHATELDPELSVPKILLKRLESRKEFLDLRDERLMELAKTIARKEGELAEFKVHAKSVAQVVRLKSDLERYKQEIPDILSERKRLKNEAKRLWQKEKELVKWNASLDEKHRWLEQYHQNLKSKEAYLNRPQVLVTLRIISILARFKNPFLNVGLTMWHLLPINIRARFGPKLKGLIVERFYNASQNEESLKDSNIQPNKKAAWKSSNGDLRNAVQHQTVKEFDLVHRPPLVSVVLPIYNHARSARLSIESILNQDYPSLEIIIVNDGSTDNLLDVLSPYVGRKNIVILDQKNQRLPKALSNGFRFARGAFLTWTSADNIMLPWQIQLEADFLLRNPKVDMTYGDVEIIDENGKPFINSNYRVQNQHPKGSSILKLPSEIESLDSVPDNFINAAFLYRQSVSQALGHYDPRLLGTEDFDYWLRTKELFNIKKLDKEAVLYQYRVHDDSLSGRYGDTHIVSNVQKLINEHQERKEYYRRPFSCLVFSEEPILEGHPLYDLAKGFKNIACNFQVLVPDTIKIDSITNFPHVKISEFKTSTLTCLRDKVVIMSSWEQGLRKVLPMLEGHDIWIGLLNGAYPIEQKGQEHISIRKVILNETALPQDVGPKEKDDLLVLNEPLVPPAILRKARDDKFPFWQFPWQGGQVYLCVAKSQNVDQTLVEAFASRFKNIDFVFASSRKEEKKELDSLLRLKNVHFFHFDSLEQLFPLVSGVSAFWAPLKETCKRKMSSWQYSWALVAAKPFVGPFKFLYSEDAPYWYSLQQENGELADLNAIARIKPERKICDEFLERHSSSNSARYVLAAANNDLFIEKKCGGKDLFKPKMPRIVKPATNRPHVVFEVGSMDKGGLEEVVYTVSSMFDRKRFRPTIACAGKGGMLSQKAQRQGLEIAIFKENRSAYEKFLKDQKVSLVNSHYSEFGVETIHSLSIPHIATIHNAYVWFEKAQRQRFRKMDNYFDHYIAVSSSVRNYLTDALGISASKITVIPNGVDTVQLQLLAQIPPRITRKTLGLEEEDFVFLNPASIDGRKNHHAMISAISELAKGREHVKLVCAGNILDQEYFGEIKKRVKELNLEKRILFPGFIQYKADLYRLADALLLPSIVEGWSIAMTEALYFGLPLILTDVGGARDVITEDWIGILVPNSFGDITKLRGENLGLYTKEKNPKNLQQIVAAMEDILDRREFWKSHAEKRRLLVQKRFCVENMIERTQELFNRFL